MAILQIVVYPTRKDLTPSKSLRGFTILEAMIALSIFTLMVFGLSSMTIQAQKMAYQNVLETAAYSVAQGYLEQIKSLGSTTIDRATDTAAPLETKSVSALATLQSEVEADDLLYPNVTDPTTLATGLQVINEKAVLVDLELNDGGAETPLTMRMWIDVEIHPVAIQLNQTTYLIDLEFAYEDRYIRGTPTTRTVWVRNGTRSYSQESRALFVGERNTGRLQLMTSLLNFDSL